MHSTMQRTAREARLASMAPVHLIILASKAALRQFIAL